MTGNAFQSAQKVEEIARRELLPWLEHIYPQIQPIDDALTNYDPAYTLQTLGGDFLMRRLDGTQFLAEFKAERKHTGNLFPEIWSDKPWRAGWFITCMANALFYYFADQQKCYVADFPALKKWAWTGNRILKFDEAPQGVYEQRNQTYGRKVWIPTLFDELPEGAIKLIAKHEGKYVRCDLDKDDWWKNDERYQRWLEKRRDELDPVPF
jgi:hypothetical protein